VDAQLFKELLQEMHSLKDRETIRLQWAMEIEVVSENTDTDRQGRAST